jgi:hypothetical protein
MDPVTSYWIHYSLCGFSDLGVDKSEAGKSINCQVQTVATADHEKF